MSQTSFTGWMDLARRHPTHLLLGFVLFLPWIWGLSVPLTGDQKVYVAIAAEMRERGEWLTPYLFGEPAYFKPPFQYWMTRLGWEVFGFGLLGAIFPSVLASILSAWGLSEISRLVGGRQPFIQAGLWFLASVGVLTFGSTIQMEIWLCFFLVMSWVFALRFLADPIGERKYGALFIAFGIAGLSALNKSPLYSVFFVVSFFTYLLLMGEWELLIERKFWAALGFGVLLGLSWFVWMVIRDGKEFVDFYFVQETIAKRGGNDSSPWQIWGALLYFCAPFTLMLVPAVRSIWVHRAKQFKLICLLISWTLWPALFFTLYPYRVTTYLIVLLPLAALLLDHAYLRSARGRFFNFALRLSGVLIAIGLSVAAMIVLNAGLAPRFLVVPIVLLGFGFLAAAWRGWFRGVAGISILVLLCVRLIGVWIGERDAAGLVDFSEKNPTASLAVYDPSRNIWHEVGMLSARLKKTIERKTDFASLEAHLRDGGVVILSDDQLPELSTLESSIGVASIVRTEWRRYQRRLKFPYKKLVFSRLSPEELQSSMSRRFVILERR